jgi:hypothetical protein
MSVSIANMVATSQAFATSQLQAFQAFINVSKALNAVTLLPANVNQPKVVFAYMQAFLQLVAGDMTRREQGHE